MLLGEYSTGEMRVSASTPGVSTTAAALARCCAASCSYGQVALKKSPKEDASWSRGSLLPPCLLLLMRRGGCAVQPERPRRPQQTRGWEELIWSSEGLSSATISIDFWLDAGTWLCVCVLSTVSPSSALTHFSI